MQCYDILLHTHMHVAPSSAVCAGMNQTCCEPETEKEMLVVARKHYGIIYHKSIRNHFTSCPTAGREFYRKLMHFRC